MEQDKKDPKLEALVSAIEDYAMQEVDSRYGGWENNDGASGVVTIDFTTKVGHIHHESYYTTSETDEVEL